MDTKIELIERHIVMKKYEGNTKGSQTENAGRKSKRQCKTLPKSEGEALSHYLIAQLEESTELHLTAHAAVFSIKKSFN